MKKYHNTICNKCGKTCLKGQGSDGEDVYGLIDAKVSGGYLSDSLKDMTLYHFSMCEGCLKELFDSFAVPVHEKDLLICPFPFEMIQEFNLLQYKDEFLAVDMKQGVAAHHSNENEFKKQWNELTGVDKDWVVVIHTSTLEKIVEQASCTVCGGI